jgi:hypothetical protein
VPDAPLTCLRRRRQAFAAVAICLLVWQALAVGLVAAQATMLAAGGLGAGTICHGAGGADPGNPQEPDCCTYCLATVAPVLPATQSNVLKRYFARLACGPPILQPTQTMSPRAVRAGWSQPPPSEA